jgi:NAD-dependent SIR2 family protein deacetylase
MKPIEPESSIDTPSSSSQPSNPFQTGKDLFTSTTAFSSSYSTSLYLQFISSLLLASRRSEPTRAHRILKRLEDKGKLLRLWTQNIDGLESKAGLLGGKDVVEEEQFTGLGRCSTSRSDAGITVGSGSTIPRSSNSARASTSSTSSPNRSSARPRIKQSTTIELHGNVHYARCNLCSEEYVTKRVWVDEWAKGVAVECEACQVRGESRIIMPPNGVSRGRSGDSCLIVFPRQSVREGVPKGSSDQDGYPSPLACTI